jgi:hypothetical protein
MMDLQLKALPLEVPRNPRLKYLLSEISFMLTSDRKRGKPSLPLMMRIQKKKHQFNLKKALLKRMVPL